MQLIRRYAKNIFLFFCFKQHSTTALNSLVRNCAMFIVYCAKPQLRFIWENRNTPSSIKLGVETSCGIFSVLFRAEPSLFQRRIRWNYIKSSWKGKSSTILFKVSPNHTHWTNLWTTNVFSKKFCYRPQTSLQTWVIFCVSRWLWSVDTVERLLQNLWWRDSNTHPKTFLHRWSRCHRRSLQHKSGSLEFLGILVNVFSFLWRRYSKEGMWMFFRFVTWYDEALRILLYAVYSLYLIGNDHVQNVACCANFDKPKALSSIVDWKHSRRSSCKIKGYLKVTSDPVTYHVICNASYRALLTFYVWFNCRSFSVLLRKSDWRILVAFLFRLPRTQGIVQSIHFAEVEKTCRLFHSNRCFFTLLLLTHFHTFERFTLFPREILFYQRVRSYNWLSTRWKSW